jgi:single-strand DNA-binding protein
MDLNRVSLIGNLVKDPEIRQFESEKILLKFSLATNRYYYEPNSETKINDVQFHEVVIWGKMAETLYDFLKKGVKVFVEGRLQNNVWIDKDEIKRYKTEINALQVIVLSKFDNNKNNDEFVIENKEDKNN